MGQRGYSCLYRVTALNIISCYEFKNYLVNKSYGYHIHSLSLYVAPSGNQSVSQPSRPQSGALPEDRFKFEEVAITGSRIKRGAKLAGSATVLTLSSEVSQ